MDMNNNIDVVYSTRIRLARNIVDIPFPRRLNAEEEIYSVLYQGVEKACKKLFDYDFYQMDRTADLIKSQLIEEHFISQNLADSQYGAAYISKKKDISIMVNEEDHLRIQCILPGSNLQLAYNQIAKVDEELSKNLNYAFDSRLGYLTSCPTNLGSAMRASVMVFLPALTMRQKIESLIVRLQDMGFTVRGVYGEGSKAEGFMYQISNQSAISLSEDAILKRMNSIVEFIVDTEKKERESLKKQRGVDLQDEIMRAYGTLKYACKMSSSEFNINFAMIKLGVSLGYLKLDLDKLNSLMVSTQPAMLCKMVDNKIIPPGQRDVLRAQVIKRILVNTEV